MRPTVGRIGKGKREREGFPSASRRRRALWLVYVCILLQHYTRRSCVEIKGVLACVRACGWVRRRRAGGCN